MLLQFSPTGGRILEDGLVVPGRYSAFSTSKKLTDILHKELQRRELPHIKIVVVEPKIKNKLLYLFLSLYYEEGSYFIFSLKRGAY